jgi:hypothetical protein
LFNRFSGTLAKKYCAPFHWIIRCEEAFIPRCTSGLAAAGSASKTSAYDGCRVVPVALAINPVSAGAPGQARRGEKLAQGKSYHRVSPSQLAWAGRADHDQAEGVVNKSVVDGDDIGQCA